MEEEKKETSVPVGPPRTIAEAERFMALMLEAIKSRHICPWKKYFQDLAETIVSKHVKEKRG